MQKTRNNCFGSKKCNTTLRQAKTSKHKCRNVTAMYLDQYSNMLCCYISALVLTCFRLTKGRATYFQLETIVASVLHLMVLLFKVLFNHSWKRDLWCFIIIHLDVFFFYTRKLLLYVNEAPQTGVFRNDWVILWIITP